MIQQLPAAIFTASPNDPKTLLGHDQEGRKVAEIVDRGRDWRACRVYDPLTGEMISASVGTMTEDEAKRLVQKPVVRTTQSKEYMAGIRMFERGENCPPGGDAYRGYTFAEAHYGD